MTTLFKMTTKKFLINHIKQEAASTIKWWSDKFNIEDLKPYIQFSQCFTAFISMDLEKHPMFKEGLEESCNKVNARFNFKTRNGDELDRCEIFDYTDEMYS